MKKANFTTQHWECWRAWASEECRLRTAGHRPEFGGLSSETRDSRLGTQDFFSKYDVLSTKYPVHGTWNIVHSPAFLKKATALFTALVFAWSMIFCPMGFAETINVPGGSIDVNVQDNATNWNVTGNPVWDVPEFNVPQNSIYNIAGLGTGSSLALLVNGGSASNIFGTMNLSNLDFILQNIAGINFGSSSMVNLSNASLIASTLPLNLSMTDFLARDYQFSGQGGFLMNEGRIVGTNADLVALVANAIENKGTIEVPMGTVALAAGDTVTVGISGDGLVSIGVDEATANDLGLKDQVKNTGTISAQGGRVVLDAKAVDGLFEKAINIASEPNSTAVVLADDGIIEFVAMGDIYNNAVLEAARGSIEMNSTAGSVEVKGTLNAEGGSVAVQAKENIAVTGDMAVKGDATFAAGQDIDVAANITASDALRVYADAKDLTGAAAGGNGEVHHSAGLIQAATLYIDGAGDTTLGDLKSTDGIYIGSKTSGHLMDTIAMNGQVSGTGRLYLIGDGSTTQLTTDVTTSGAAIQYDDSLELAPASGNRITLSTTGGGSTSGANITVNGTIDSDSGATPRDLTLDAGLTGNISISGAIGGTYALGNLTITKSAKGEFAAVNSATVTNYGSIDSGTFSGALTNYGGQELVVSIFNAGGTLVLDEGQTVHLLMVGGGGAGAISVWGGGGGAGEFYENESYSIEAGSYAVTIGAGGVSTTKGGDTSLGSLLTVAGGGYGGMNTGGDGGGSGGGGGGYPDGDYGTTSGGSSAATIGLGSSGGSGFGCEDPGSSGGGGGGGAGGAGGNYPTGTGGAGIVSSITGTAVEYAKGGSAGSLTPGAANTGSGGGSGGYSEGLDHGGSGVVVVEYTDVFGIKGGTFNGTVANEAGGKVTGGVINGGFTQNDGLGPYSYTWTGTTDGNLNNVTNYSGGNGIPGGADSLTIDVASYSSAPSSGTLNALAATIASSSAVNGGIFNLSGLLTNAGSISYDSASINITAQSISSSGTIETATSGDINLKATDGATTFDLGTLSSAGAINIGTADYTPDSVTMNQDITTASAVTVKADAISLKAVTTSGAQAYTGATTLNGTLSAGGNIVFNSAVTLAGSSGTIGTTSGAITFINTVDGAVALDLDATGAITIGGDATNLSSLDANSSGSGVITGDVTTSGAQNYTGAESIDLRSLVAGTTVAVSGSTVSVNAVTTGGAQAYTGATTLSGTLSAGGNIDFNSAVTLAGSSGTIGTTSGDITFDSTVDGAVALDLDATGAITIAGAATNLTSLDANSSGATVSVNAVTTSGAQAYTGATTLNGTLSAGGTIDFNSAVTLAAGSGTIGTSSGDITFDSTVDGAVALDLDATGAITITGTATNLTSLDANSSGGTVSVGAVTTTGDQIFSGAVTQNGKLTVGDDFTLSSGSFSQGADIDVTGDFTVSSGASFTDSNPYYVGNEGGHTFAAGNSFSVPSDDGGTSYFNRYGVAYGGPYTVRDIYDLQAMKCDLAGDYTLAGDISASSTSTWNSGAGFDPVGTLGGEFIGEFDGYSKIISGLYINRSTNNIGLFGYTGEGADIHDVGLTDVTISGNGTYVGGLIGDANNSTITSCYVSGTVSGSASIGGLVGFASGSSTITSSYTSGTVSGSLSIVGGLVGDAASCDITSSYSSSTVSGSGSLGGLLGSFGSVGYVNHSYSTGLVNGGVEGAGIGGFIGDNSGDTFTSNYWDTETSGQTYGVDGDNISNVTGKTTAEMKQEATFSGWNFTDTWRIYEGYTYPLLKSFLTALTVTANASSKTYDGTTAVSGSGVVYSIDPSSELKTDSLSYTSSDKNVGARAITPTGLWSTQQGYDVTYVSGDLTINTANLDIYATTDTRDYNGSMDSAVAPTTSEVYGTDSVTDLLQAFDSKNVLGTGNSTLSVTGYTVNDGNAGANYAVTLHTATGTITAKGLTVTATGPSKIYGTALTAGTSTTDFTADATGVGSEEVTGVTLTPDVSGLSATTAAGLGYVVVVSDATGSNGFLATNYNIIYTPYTGTVATKAMTVTANDRSKTYGDTLVLGTTAFTALALESWDSISGVTLTSSGAINTAGVSGSPYTITSSAAAGTGLSNYEITYANGSLTVNSAALSITAAADSKTYDGLPYSGGNGVEYAGFVNGETATVLGGTLAYSGTSQGAIDAGNYVITPEGLTSGNYTISFINGILTINEAPAPPPTPVTPVTPEAVNRTLNELQIIPVVPPPPNPPVEIEEDFGDGPGPDPVETFRDSLSGGIPSLKNVPILNFFNFDMSEEEKRKLLTQIRVVEGAVYVIDSENEMSLIGQGEGKTVLFKPQKASSTKSGMTADAAPLPVAPRKAVPGSEATKLQGEAPDSGRESSISRKPAVPVVLMQAPGGARYGTLKNPGKDVFVRKPGGQWQGAADGMVILPGDEVRTAAKNSVEVLLDEGKTGHIEIKEGSLFRINKAAIDALTGDKTTLLDLAIGRVMVHAEKLKGNSKFEVKTPTVITGVRGTVFEVIVEEKT